MFNNFRIGKNFDMDRMFVTNLEDKEVLYESARDRENVRSDPRSAKDGADLALSGEGER